MIPFNNTELLEALVEKLNDHYPNDMLSLAYEALMHNEAEDFEDSLAIFLLTEIANVINPRHTPRKALKVVIDHLTVLAEDIDAFRRALKNITD